MSDAVINEDDAGEVPNHLPLDAWHRARGARMVPFAGYLMPIQYEGIVAEHLWTRDSAGLFDVSHMGQVQVSGPGWEVGVEALLPIDLATLKLGQLRYSLLLDDAGGILDDLMVARWPDSLYLVVNGATKWDDLAWMREHLDDAITLNHLDDRALLALQGPRAFDVLAPVVAGEWGLDALTFMRGGRFTIDGVDAWISRSGYTGEDGFEISIPADRAGEVADRLCADERVRPIGLGARDSLRLEAGLPLYGHDLDPNTGPVEADLGFAINKRRRTEGGFIGADRVLSALAGGVARRRVGLAVEGRVPVREGAPIFTGAVEVGRVTSGGFGPSVGAPVAMGYVATTHVAPGTCLEAEVRGRRVPLTVAPLPFIPHRYHRQPAKEAAQ